MTERIKGTMTAWRRTWGFAERDDHGPDVFVHESEIQCDGFRAIAVRKLEAAAPIDHSDDPDDETSR